jgi:cell division protein ZapB
MPEAVPAIDPLRERGHIPAMETELQRLEQRVGELLALVRQLAEENRALRSRQDNLSGERAALLQKNEQVRASVEAMIGRLRLLESGV